MNNLINKLTNQIAYLPTGKYAIAVSGGSDSLALLYLIANSKFNKSNFIVVHFDHACRAESSDEANFVEQLSKTLGFKFIKHVWSNNEKADTNGNFYQSARKARYKFFSQVVTKNNLNGVLVAHSKTDLAETLLMRLGKGASIKGASIFKQGINIDGVNVYRPLLDFTRKDLQDYLTHLNIEWKNDPSNEDDNKMRPRLRKLLDTLENVGVSLSGMKASVNYFNQADDALEFYFEKELLNLEFNNQLFYFNLNTLYFRGLPSEIKVRFVNYIITKLTNCNFKHLPRRKNIIELLNRIESGTSKVEQIDEIRIELIENTLFFYRQDISFENLSFEPTQENIIPAKQIQKDIRYNLLKKNNLQLLPKDIKDILPFKVHKNSAEKKASINDFSCLVGDKKVKIVYNSN